MSDEQDAADAWWAAYGWGDSRECATAMKIATDAALHWGMWGHFPTDPFIKTCLICGKDW